MALVQVVWGYGSNACLHHSKKSIAKLTRRERDPSTPHPKCESAVDGWDLFFKGTIYRTLKRLKLLDEPVAGAYVYLCMCARAISCMVATFLQASYL